MRTFDAKLIIAIAMSGFGGGAFAQAAGAGADYNRADRAAAARQSEIARLMVYDKPVYKDPIGNALIGAPTTALIRGPMAGATSILTGTATGTALELSKRR